MLQAIVPQLIPEISRRLWIIIVTGIFLNCPLAIGDETVDQLIEALDSPQFAVRESATRELVRIGGPALRPLSQHYFSSSPEKAWRIKRILEDIGTTNEEPETCFKSIGILFVIDSNVGNGIVELLDDWKENRSKKAIEFLTSQGATFTSEFNGVSRQIGGVNIDLPRMLDQELDARANATPQTEPDPTPPTKLDSKTIREKVDQILNGSLTENENFVWDLYRQLQPKNGTTPAQLAGNPFIINRRDQIIIRNNGAAFLSPSRSNDIVVTLNKNWKGSAKDLTKLDQIYQLSGLRFQDRSLSTDDANALAELDQLKFLAIKECDTNGFNLRDMQLPSSIEVLELGSFQLDEAELNKLAALKLLALRMDDCKFTPSGSKCLAYLTTIRELSWTRTPISSQLFEAMAQLPKLEIVNLSVSKFTYDDKKKFDAQRPDCRFINMPVAFLGVQGPQTITSYQREEDCLIEQVVADSSAARAGIEPGDIIRKVSGQPIEKFEELRMFITQHGIGESIELDVERNGKMIKIPVELGSVDEALVR